MGLLNLAEVPVASVLPEVTAVPARVVEKGIETYHLPENECSQAHNQIKD